jgi:hypothetical protein
VWYYGDLGIAVVLHQVALRMGRDGWRRRATSLLDHSLVRGVENG